MQIAHKRVDSVNALSKKRKKKKKKVQLVTQLVIPLKCNLCTLFTHKGSLWYLKGTYYYSRVLKCTF